MGDYERIRYTDLTGIRHKPDTQTEQFIPFYIRIFFFSIMHISLHIASIHQPIQSFTVCLSTVPSRYILVLIICKRLEPK